MKIAIISQPADGVIPPRQGSIGIWIYQIASQLSKTVDTLVFTSWKPSQRHSHNSHGFTLNLVYALPSKAWDVLSPLYALLRSRKRSFFASRFYHFEYSLQVALQLRRQACDVVHVHNYPQCAWWIRRFNPQTKIVLHMHCQWLSQVDADQLSRLLPGVDLILGVSDFITDKIRQRFPELASRCHTVYNGVNLHTFPEKMPADASRPGKLLYIGRISPEKGIHLLLDAFSHISQTYPDLTLAIVGPEWITPEAWLVSLSGEIAAANLEQCYQMTDAHNKPIGYLDQLKAQMTPEVAQRVNFVGLVAHERLTDYYQKADILINASFSDAFPMPIPEAMVSGLPIIAARVGGIPEAIDDGKTGILFDPGDVQALSAACLRLLEDNALRAAMGKAARQKGLAIFSWQAITEQLLAHYRP